MLMLVFFIQTDRAECHWALDLIEEFRAVYAESHLYYPLINKKIVNGKNFSRKENGAVLMDR